MSQHVVLKRLSVALVGGALAAVISAPTATARPDDEALRGRHAISSAGCPLERIADQLVRCDNLTGAGVPAPSFVPEWN